VKAAEFKRKIEKLEKKYQLSCSWDTVHGKGSHETLSFGKQKHETQGPQQRDRSRTAQIDVYDLGVNHADWTIKTENAKKND
jgi:hypothetical protein